MSGAPVKANKAGWGSFLSSAVSGLESRLDNILADEDGPAKGSRTAAQRREAIAKAVAQKAGEDADSRASSRSRTNDRLQERLAKAVNKGGDVSRAGSRPPGSGKATPEPGPALNTESTLRISVDSKTSDAVLEQSVLQTEPITKAVEEGADKGQPLVLSEQEVLPEPEDNATASTPTPELPGTSSTRPSQDSASRQSLDALATAPPEPVPSPLPRMDSTLQAELERLQHEDKQRQEEMHAHLERIDALQAKLQYLAKQAAETAKQAVADAPSGSLERKLAEKEEQISLLMDEGLRMSKTELRLQTSIKEMRKAKMERDRGDAELRRRIEKTEQERAGALEGKRKAESRIKDAEAKVAIVDRIEKDVDGLKREKEQAQELIRDLRRQLGEAVTRAEEAEKKAQTDKLEQERRTVADLREELDNLKIEKKLAEDRQKTETREWREESTRKEEKAKMVETELRNEIMNLETKLELLRSRTEEASSAAGGDSQTKLLRQVETLQTQYALASENWQGIEATLNTRVAALEKERDEISRRESDVRRKAREVNSKSRRLEDDLEAANEKARSLEQDVQEQASTLEKMQKRVEHSETALAESRAELAREKAVWEADFQTRLDEEKTKLRLELQSHAPSNEPPFLRTDSPTTAGAIRKASAQDLGMLSALGTGYTSTRRNRGLSSEVNSIGDRPQSRRAPSSLPFAAAASAFASPSVSSPARGLGSSSINGAASHQHHAPPSIDAIPDDDYVSETPVTGTSSPQHRGSNAGAGTPVADLMSASTVNAGPSVQLVERMSAAVRRLESEKASLKEELSRLSGQRDEAREEVVKLMQAAETTKEVEERLKVVEGELKETREKWDHTLEALGEREEQCEELRNDVMDLKGIIREMAEERAQK